MSCSSYRIFLVDYNFTANVEQKFDDIAEGKTEWTKWMKDFDKRFEPEVNVCG